jgi:hypothetical protein
MTPAYALACKLGWSNADCGPEPFRLYALDAGDDPRWAHPHARVAETPLIRDVGCREGDRCIVVYVGGVASPELLERYRRAAEDAVNAVARAE